MLSMFKVTLYTFTCLLFAKSVVGQICASATTCTECIRLPANCFWCAQPDYARPGQRCINRDMADSSGCNMSMVEDPMGSSIITMNDTLGEEFVQVSPQRFQLKLRPGDPQTVQVQVSPARNFPVDVYYLMDLSFSMNDDLVNLQRLADDLANTISNITDNFQLGFGSFVDKRLVPYISVESARLTDPCQEDGVRCERTYNTRHSLSLTNNAEEFARRINQQIISGNLDSPEGGLDALLQVIVCQDIIGWRERARHIVVFLTDAGFHFAGDGKLGGVVIPNDGKCHLERLGSNYMYTMAETLDYPSVGQLNSLLQEYDIIPIFAAEATAMGFYTALEQVIPTAFVGTLAADSRNVVELIETSYNTISQTVTLNADEVPGITIDVNAMCPNNDSPDRSSCTGVQIEQIATFNVTVTAQSCSEELRNEGVDVTVRIPGFGQFVMELSGVCECGCTSNEIPNSPFCNFGNGTLVCGQCDCNDGWVGDTCECASSNISTDGCPRGSNNETCTSADRGTCVCSTCQCNELDAERRYFGPACECDNFSCDLDARGLVCGGPTQGMCSCNQTCICLPRWTGRACDCDTSTELCVSSLGAVCSGRGTCLCGECICSDSQFSGQFCEICTGSECPDNPECMFFRDCAVCASNPEAANCSVFNCSTSNVGTVGNVNTATYRIGGTTRTSFCTVTQGDCAYQYFVGTTGSTITSDNAVVEVMEPDCGEEEEGVEPWIIIVAILGGLILLAIIILVIIRVIIELRYCVEFRQWKKELERARFAKNDNPLFQKATEDFVNPAYGK